MWSLTHAEMTASVERLCLSLGPRAVSVGRRSPRAHGPGPAVEARCEAGGARRAASDGGRRVIPHEIARLSVEDEVAPQRKYFTDYGSPGDPRSRTTIASTTGRGRWTIDPRGEAEDTMPVVPAQVMRMELPKSKKAALRLQGAEGG